MISVGQLSFHSLLPGNGPSLIRLNFLTAASVTVRRSLMNKSLLCNFFWSISNISRMSPISEVIHFCWWFQIFINPLASVFSFLSLVLSGACICCHTLMQTGRLFSLHQLQLVLGKPDIVVPGELLTTSSSLSASGRIVRAPVGFQMPSSGDTDDLRVFTSGQLQSFVHSFQ